MHTRLNNFVRWINWQRKRADSPRVAPPQFRRPARTHVIVIDGTMCSRDMESPSNAALAADLLESLGSRVSVHYEAGLQYSDLRSGLAIVTGYGLDLQIRLAYGALASRYREGDKIFLFGYSRGAFAVRSLAGMIGRIGLLRPKHATPRMVRVLWELYENDPFGESARRFAKKYCHPRTDVEMIGAWDTVRALGAPLPFLKGLRRYDFHDHEPGPHIKACYHALALHETRSTFAPLKWTPSTPQVSPLEQVWFAGNHGDVGGNIASSRESRLLSNIPFVWMLEKAEARGLALPLDWKSAFPRDIHAPSAGEPLLWTRLFASRRTRRPELGANEWVHSSVADHSPCENSTYLKKTLDKVIRAYNVVF